MIRGNPVERLRERLAFAVADNPGMVVGVTQEELRALLAVVEAAQALKDWCEREQIPLKSLPAEMPLMLWPLWDRLQALHTQASDEGTPGGE